MKRITIRDMSFSYPNKRLFSHVSLGMKKGSFVTILGKTGSGKTTFAKILVGMLPFTGKIYLNGKVLERKNFPSLRKCVSYIPESFYLDFSSETVQEEMKKHLHFPRYRKSKIYKEIFSILSLFGLEDEMEEHPQSFSISKKAMIKLAEALVTQPKILIIDSLFSYMDFDDKKKALSILEQYRKSKGLTILSIMSDAEDIYIGTDVLLLCDGKISLYCKKEDIYQHEKEFSDSFVSLPFMTLLSNKLSYYSLINHVILDKREMVHTLWK